MAVERLGGLFPLPEFELDHGKVWLHTEQRLRKNLVQPFPMGAGTIHAGPLLRVGGIKFGRPSVEALVGGLMTRYATGNCMPQPLRYSGLFLCYPPVNARAIISYLRSILYLNNSCRAVGIC
jgi:hypothetical protein